jgi:mRNA interferase MazF
MPSFDPGGVPITHLRTAGLPVPSVIRTAKIATIEALDATRLGRVSPSVLARVAGNIARVLDFGRRPA